MTPLDGFVWTDVAWGRALRCAPLLEAADHFFTTRALWLRGRSEADDWSEVAGTIGVPPGRLLRMTQVHGVDAVVFGRGESAGGDWPEADVAMTDDPSVALAVQVADCVPLLLADTRSSAVAAVHAGWRGTAAGAASAAVERMSREFGTRPRDVVAALGPSIGPCCYEVGREVAGAFRIGRFAREAEGWFVRGGDGRFVLDLWTANRDQLAAAGVPAGAIHHSGLCTASRPDLFASYRRDGPGTGRIAAVIRSRPRRARAG